MNPSLELRMKRHVERIVRPVRARWQRKLRMREDLYAHLLAAFDEESRRCPAEDDAFAAAVRRLGEPATLTHDLQSSVPRSDRVLGRLQAWIGAGIAESPARTALRVGTTTLLLTFLGSLGAVSIASVLKPAHPTGHTSAVVLLAVSLWTSVWSASIVGMMVHVGQSTVGELRNRRGAAIWIAALLALPFIPPLWTYWITAMWDTVWMWGALLCAIVSLGIGFNAGLLLGKELQQRHPWEGLDLSAE
jgi:hypothetical protein